ALRRDTAPTANPGEILLPRAPMDALRLLERALTRRRRKNDTDDPQRESDTVQVRPERTPEETVNADPWVRCAVVLSFTETLAPTGDMVMLSPADRTAIVTLQRWAADKTIASNGALIVLLARDVSQMHADARSAYSESGALSRPLP